MRLSILEKDDGTLGKDFNDECQCLYGYPFVDPKTGECSCIEPDTNGGDTMRPFNGDDLDPAPPLLQCPDGYQAVTQRDGSQQCWPVGANGPTPPLTKPLIRTGEGGPWPYMPYSNTSVVNSDRPKQGGSIIGADGKIFGFSPLVVVGAAAVGVWLLSSMDTKGGKRNV